MKVKSNVQIIDQVSEKAKNTKLGTVILLFLLIITFAISLICFFSNGYSYRKTFLFEGLDKDCLFAENRFFPSVKNVDKVELYVSELVLGPVGNRYKNLFEPGTKVNSCFVKNHVLYVDLSSQALFASKNTSELSKAVPLFRKNIKKNFSSIKDVKLFIDGKLVENY